MTASQLFSQKNSSRLAVASIFALLAVFVTAVCWSHLMPVAEISANSGEVRPSVAVQKVQHLEGGIVSELLVDEGEVVARGQPLVRMAPDLIVPELEQFETRYLATTLRIRLLASALDGSLENLGDMAEGYEDIVAAERASLVAKRASMENQTVVLSQQVSERKAALATLQTQTEAFDQQIDLTGDRLKRRRALVEKGLTPQMELVDDERDYIRLLGERTRLTMEEKRIQAQIRESQLRITELESRFKAEIAAEISNLTNVAAELQHQIRRARDQVERLTVNAPVAGRVQGLQYRTIGGVVPSGGTLMEIVPSDAVLFVEARINTRDIGHVHPGQDVTVKVLTYDYSRYGSIRGKVHQVSPSTFMSEDGTPFYKARIDLEEPFVGGRQEMTVSPGMTVIADIVTGEKTLLTYLTAPVMRGFDAAMHER
ncbi:MULTISPECIES: HlyD family type I secretion periplasmic adaptor subunit [unclassified Labrenzia]|uniref:HlyD family type I secretion periplasmic adaptor subunit n=1 Tax=unclassified Labrenzia TaxID=2648686 RepID=UPI0004B66294|nr:MULTISPECIES: HlyD family type I secretion periplasmic adaptor subunit [unclassified Labrenzia]